MYMERFVIGVTGASGIILALKTIRALVELNYELDVVFSQHAIYTAHYELGHTFTTPAKILETLPQNVQKKVKLHPFADVGSSICSGSYQTRGMVIIPCSMATVAAISMGLSDNSLRRAADVTIKEKRPLILVPRETPFSEIHLENMLRLAKLGTIILPPIPAWYNDPQSLDDVENFVVGKVLDLLKIEHNLYKRWPCSKK